MPEEERRISPAAVIPIGLGLGLVATLAIAASTLAAPPTPPGKANLYGKVTDAVTGGAILDVLATLNGIETYTDTEGNYAFADLEPGSYRLEFSKEGYETAVF